MTDLQYQIIDTLYFVIGYSELVKDSEIESHIIDNEIIKLVSLEWIQAMEREPTRQEFFKVKQFNHKKLKEYYYLATKKGLLEHNSL